MGAGERSLLFSGKGSLRADAAACQPHLYSLQTERKEHVCQNEDRDQGPGRVRIAIGIALAVGFVGYRGISKLGRHVQSIGGDYLPTSAG